MNPEPRQSAWRTYLDLGCGASANRSGHRAAVCAPKPKRIKLVRFVGRAFFGLALLGVVSFGGVAEAASSPVFTYTAQLNFQGGDEVLVSRWLVVRSQTTAFTKEPTVGKKDVRRGSLLWRAQPERSTCFIWDKGQGKLYLDLNGNRDLTDDPNGVFSSLANTNFQSFTNVPISLPTRQGERVARVILQMQSTRPESVSAYAGLCSYWQGMASLHDVAWQLGLVEDLLDDKPTGTPRYFLVRPWAERDRRWNLAVSTPDGCDYTRNVFFGNHAYELNPVLALASDPSLQGGGLPVYRLTLTEQTPKLGQLNVTGNDLHRIIITAASASSTVIIDRPAGPVKIPIGSYSLDEIWLRKGEKELRTLKAGNIKVSENKVTNLVAGGPLTNSVDGTAQGVYLRLGYKVVGADGRQYEFSREDRAHPPEFAIFRGTNRLATGKFEFG